MTIDASCPDDGAAVLKALREAAARRILVLDGAMGTELQRSRFSEADFRGARFKDWKQDVRGNNDLLILTQPDADEESRHQQAQAGQGVAEQAEHGRGKIPAGWGCRYVANVARITDRVWE